MKRLLSVMMVCVLATAASADNLMYSHPAPWAAYAYGRSPYVYANYSFGGTPYYYSAHPFVRNFGFYRPAFANWYAPNFGYAGYGYAGCGYGYGYGYNTPAYANYPAFTWGYNAGYANPYSLNVDTTIPMAGFAPPALENELTTVPDAYVDRSLANSLAYNNAAKLTMTVPADAVVSIQGERMQQTGTTRTFITPSLSGPTSYDITVRRTIDGKDSEQTMSVMVQPGQQSSITVLR